MRIFLWIVCLAVIGINLYLGFHWWQNKQKQDRLIKQKVVLFQSMKKELSGQVSQFNGGCSIYVKDLTYPKLSLSLQKTRKFPAASLIKVPLMAVIFTAIDQGKLSLDQKILIEPKDTVNGSGQIKGMYLPIELTIKDLVEYMIAYSDNTATNKFIDLLGYAYINDTFKQLGLENTFLRRKMMDFSRRKQGVENFTCAWDIALILEMIYQKKMINQDYSDLAMEILKKQKVRDRLPYYLPESTPIAHKTGLENGIVHDAGIIFTASGDYIICVLTADAVNNSQAKKFIANLSLLTYNLYLHGVCEPSQFKQLSARPKIRLRSPVKLRLVN